MILGRVRFRKHGRNILVEYMSCDATVDKPNVSHDCGVIK